MNLSDDYLKNYLKRFQIIRNQTLLPMDWSMLVKNRCPHCFNKLSKMVTKNKLICRSKKHKRTFIISEHKINEVVNSLIHNK